jgi:threonine synthase
MDMLECLLCGGQKPWNPFDYFCPVCHEPMFFETSPGRRLFHDEKTRPLERYLDFLPIGIVNPRFDLGEGDTPLVPLENLGADIGVRALYGKCETMNPTSSFKDRGTAVAVQKAAALGFRKIGTVSTGNMAASTAAYGARAGLETIVLLKEETPLSGILTAGVYGPRLVRVKGDYGGLFKTSLEIGRHLDVWFINSVDPVRVEGYKLTGFEVFRQLGNDVPGLILVPVSSAGHFIGLVRAFEDLMEGGWAGRFPKFVGVQAEGCAPLASAFAAGRDRFKRLDRAETVAHAISNPAPPAGNTALKLTRDHGGLLISVSDREILEAQRRLAMREGLFVQPESAVTLAGLTRLILDGGVNGDDRTVLILTGSGLKAPRALESQAIRVEQADLEGLERALKE